MNDDDAIDRESSPLWLSYPLSPETPAYGGGDGLQVLPLTAISRGDTANTLLLTLPNHLGTHVDVPIHFFEGAQDLASYGASDWIFTAPLLVDVETCNGDLVVPEHLPVDLPGDTGSASDPDRSRGEPREGLLLAKWAGTRTGAWTVAEGRVPIDPGGGYGPHLSNHSVESRRGSSCPSGLPRPRRGGISFASYRGYGFGGLPGQARMGNRIPPADCWRRRRSRHSLGLYDTTAA